MLAGQAAARRSVRKYAGAGEKLSMTNAKFTIGEILIILLAFDTSTKYREVLFEEGGYAYKIKSAEMAGLGWVNH